MSFAVRFVYNEYIRGEGLDRVTDSFLDKIYGSNDSGSSDMGRTITKVALYWAAVSLVIVVMAKLVALSLTGVLVGLALVPFAMPLYRNMKFLITTKTMSDADWIIANCKAACKSLEEEVRDLKATIQRIDAFVAERPDLRKIIQEHVEKYGEYIARPGTPPKIIVEGPDDWIRRRGVFQIQVDDLKFELNERKRFVQMHPEVRACFEKHVLAMRKGPGTIGEAKLIGVAEGKLLSPAGLQIEEISGGSSSETVNNPKIVKEAM